MNPRFLRENSGNYRRKHLHRRRHDQADDLSRRTWVERFKLAKGRKVYAVTLADDGVAVRNFQQKEEELHLSWDNIWRAYQRKDCVYLYAAPAKAFLLPRGQADASDQAVLEALKEKLPPSKLFLS